MIDCPICQQKNEDDARFCAECGQRLGAAQQAVAPPPPAAFPPPPAQAAPTATAPTTSNQNPPGGGRLSSPLLSGVAVDSPGSVARPEPAGEMDRLRQMNARAQDKGEPAPAAETPFKNPFDPRNTLGAEASPTITQPQPQPQSQPTVQPQAQQPGKKTRAQLRSPLLQAEEFEEGDPALAEQPPEPQGRGGGRFRSPLLGSGGGGGVENYYETPGVPDGEGGALRSPLLGPGGSERRSGSGGNYSGAERRGLRSPLLSSMVDDAGGGHSGQFYEEEDSDYDPYEDVNNPNVLRSPLLAARSHGLERRQEPRQDRNQEAALNKQQAPAPAVQPVVQAPATPPPPPPFAAPAAPAPPAQPAAQPWPGDAPVQPPVAPASAVAAAAAAPAPQPVHGAETPTAEAQHFHRTRAQSASRQAAAPAPGLDPRHNLNQKRDVPPMPQVGGPSTQLDGRAASAPEPAEKPATPSAGAVGPIGGSFISMAPPAPPIPEPFGFEAAPNSPQIAQAAMAALASAATPVGESHTTPKKGRSRILEEQGFDNEPYPSNDMRSYGGNVGGNAHEENPLIKLIGFGAIGMLVLKVFAIFGCVTSSQGASYMQFMPWVIDQVVGLGVIVAVAVMALVPRR